MIFMFEIYKNVNSLDKSVEFTYNKDEVKGMLKEISQRQSIRKYQDRAIEEEKIMEVLKAAMNAPTARNAQSWRFMVIKNRQALDSMTALQPYTQMMKTAPCAIMVLGDRQTSQPDEYLYCDCSAAIENMCIEAVHQGLGTCWCAIGPNAERIAKFRNAYDIQENLLPIAVVAIGYSDEKKELIDRFDQNKITFYE